MLRFENALSALKMIKDQIQCQSQSLLSFCHTEYEALFLTGACVALSGIEIFSF